HARQLLALIDALRAAMQTVASSAKADAEFPYRIAGEILNASAMLLFAYMWLRMEGVAYRQLEAGADDGFLQAKCDNADYFYRYLLPEADLYLARIERAHEALPQVHLPV